jgi:hypothetical protein
MKGYIGGLIRMTGLNAGTATGNMRTNAPANAQNVRHDVRHDVRHKTAPHPIHSEETVIVKTPPSQTHSNPALQEISPERAPEMNPSLENPKPEHRDIPATHLNSTEPTTQQLSQTPLTINPSPQHTKPPQHLQSPRNPRDSHDSHKPEKSQCTSSPPETIETSQIREQIGEQAHNSSNKMNVANNTKNPVPEIPHNIFTFQESAETLQIRGQENRKENRTNTPTSSKHMTEIRGQEKKTGSLGNPNSLSTYPEAFLTQESSFDNHSVSESVPGMVEPINPSIPRGIPVITLEDIRQYVAESESPTAPKPTEQPQFLPHTGHESMDHITSVPAAQPQIPVQTKQQEPIETQQFNLSIGSINLTVEAPEPQMQTVPPLPPESKRHASYSGETTNTRWGRNYIRIK